jgi:hypothetical protein
MTNIPDGYGFVAGRSRANAKAILAAAEAAGVDVNLVQTVADGYIAPEDAVKQFEKGLGAPDEEVPEEAPAEEPEPEPEKKPRASRARKTPAKASADAAKEKEE